MPTPLPRVLLAASLALALGGCATTSASEAGQPSGATPPGKTLATGVQSGGEYRMPGGWPIAFLAVPPATTGTTLAADGSVVHLRVDGAGADQAKASTR